MMHRFSNTHFSASGVALADILANSVAVLLILILLMVSIKQQQAETQLEQTVDLSVMMARELADSVVLDALPNSRPAYLHDYSSCAIPHDCNPNLYPIIEIHDEYMAVFNPPIKLNRKQLLQDNNLLDVYLRGLSNDQLNNVRVDIYGIGMFYLAISTLREYGAPLNHWHFLGEKATPARPEGGDSEGEDKLAELLKQGEEGLSSSAGKSGSIDNNQPLPEGADLADLAQFESLESDSLLPVESLEGGPDQESEQGGENAARQGDLLNELLGEFARRRDGENGQAIAQNNDQTFRLRIPNYVPPENAPPVQLDLDQERLEEVLLGFIFAALNDANEQLRFDPERLGLLFADIAASPSDFTAPVNPSLIRDLKQILRGIPTLTEELVQLQFDQDQRADTNPVNLRLRPNAAIEELRLQNRDLLPGQIELLEQGNAAVDLLLRAYPFVYRGERVAVAPNMLVLSLPQNLRRSDQHWRPVAIVSPDLQEITLGFSRAGYKDGMLELPLEVNQVRANSSVLQTSFSVPAVRSLWRLVFGYGVSILLLGLLLWLFVRWHLAAPKSAFDTKGLYRAE